MIDTNNLKITSFRYKTFRFDVIYNAKLDRLMKSPDMKPTQSENSKEQMSSLKSRVNILIRFKKKLMAST